MEKVVSHLSFVVVIIFIIYKLSSKAPINATPETDFFYEIYITPNLRLRYHRRNLMEGYRLFGVILVKQRTKFNV